MKKTSLSLLIISASAASFLAGNLWAQIDKSKSLQTQIIHHEDARTSGGDWGSISIYTGEETETHGTDSMLTAMLEFLPGKQLQPPHQHPEEEFTYIVEGSGTWSLNGVESEIQTGDLLYAAPGDWHGIANTTGEPLKFFVFKWQSRGVESPILSTE